MSIRERRLKKTIKNVHYNAKYNKNKDVCLKPKGGRKREYMSINEEKEFMKTLEAKALKGLILTSSDIKKAVENKLGRDVSDDYIWDLFKRNGWTKHTPRPSHPKKDENLQEEFKKKLKSNLASAENDFDTSLVKLPIRLYFQDEARFGRINNISKCWCVKGVIPKVHQQQVREYSYVFSSICPETGNTYSLIMPRADSEAMNYFLQALSVAKSKERIVLCLDKAGWHTTKLLIIPQNIILWHLPPYSPELNPVELFWRELRKKYFNNKTFNSMEDVDAHLMYAINDFTANKESIKKLTKISYL